MLKNKTPLKFWFNAPSPGTAQGLKATLNLNTYIQIVDPAGKRTRFTRFRPELIGMLVRTQNPSLFSAVSILTVGYKSTIFWTFSYKMAYCFPINLQADFL